VTLAQAIKQADKSARSSGEVRFVVRESGEYHVASEFDLDTFFAGIRDDSILFRGRLSCGGFRIV
jgi:hypothetical protein